MTSKKRLELDLSIWQRFMLLTIVRSQRPSMENSYRGHKILDVMNFTDAEAEEIDFVLYPTGATWNQKAKNKYVVVLKGRPLIRWLKEIVEPHVGWPPDKYEESLDLRQQLGIVDEFDDDKEDEEEEEAIE